MVKTDEITYKKKMWECPQLTDLSVKKTEGGTYSTLTEDKDGFNVDQSP